MCFTLYTDRYLMGPGNFPLVFLYEYVISLSSLYFFFILYLSEYIVLPDILYSLVGSQLLFKNAILQNQVKKQVLTKQNSPFETGWAETTS